MTFKWNKLLLASIIATTTLSGCVPLLVGGAIATTASVATDRRSAAAQLADKEIDIRAAHRLSKNKLGNLANIDEMSYNQKLYLIGDVPSDAVRQEAVKIASDIPNVTQVIDRLQVGRGNISYSSWKDKWLSTKVQTALLQASGVPYRTINILTYDGVVYLMGIVTHQEGELAAATAAHVSGVKEVVKAFEYITPQELNSGVYTNSINPDINSKPSN